MEIDFYLTQKLLPKFQMHSLKELSLISVKDVNLLNQFLYGMPNLQKLKLSCPRYEYLLSSANSVQQNGLGIILELKELIVLFLRIKDLGLKNVFGVEGDEKTKWQWEGDLNATIQKVFNKVRSTHFFIYLILFLLIL